MFPELKFDQLSEFRKNVSDNPSDAVCEGWWLRFSKRGDRAVLTATLWPAGRGSIVADWERLGNILAVMGVPPTAEFPPSVTEAPNVPHTWAWLE